MVFSVLDIRLCLLWGECGFSWEALEKRLCATRFEDVELSLPRLATKAQTLRRVCREASLGEREQAVRWLVALGPRSVPAVTDDEMTKLATSKLVERMERSFLAMPRREMQELVRRGEAAVPALIRILQRVRMNPRPPGLLWALVVAGAIGAGEAVDALAGLLRHPSSEIASATAEALGRVGPPALDVLRRAASSGRGSEAVYAYGGLAMMHTDEAYEFLCTMLTRSTRHADVAAGALARHRRPEAMTVLRPLSRRVPGWMRGAVTDAIALLRDDRPIDAIMSDWRLRYRRLPNLGWGVPPSWIQIAALARDHRRTANGTTGSSRLAAHRFCEPSNRRCRRCKGDIWEPIGLPVCAHTASTVVELQAGIMRKWYDEGISDVWTALDVCDGADVARVASPMVTSSVAGTMNTVAIARATLYWMVTVGLEDLRAGARYMRCVARDMRVLYGPHQHTPSEGRNSPRFPYSIVPTGSLPQIFS